MQSVSVNYCIEQIKIVITSALTSEESTLDNKIVFGLHSVTTKLLTNIKKSIFLEALPHLICATKGLIYLKIKVHCKDCEGCDPSIVYQVPREIFNIYFK